MKRRSTGRTSAPPALQRPPLRSGEGWLRSWEDKREAHEAVLAVNYAELEARARAMMPLPKCPTCGTPFAPDGDALADSFHQACACTPKETP